MNIAFVCGCLELGRDGVGDYTRRLASELQDQGHRIACIALYDSFIKEAVSPHNQIEEDLSVFRIPDEWSDKQRYALAKQWISDINPKWLSLQFVPFSFHDRGIPFALGQQLAALGQGRLWHIMIHELWVGMSTTTSTKYFFWSMIQRFVIKRLITQLHPKIIHTQLRLYQIHLERMKFTGKLLPLFSNIQKSARFLLINTPITLATKKISLIVFGMIHPENPTEDFARDAAQYSKKNSIDITLNLVGRCGQEQEKWVKTWKEAGLHVNVLGEQTPEQISEILFSGTLGISTTPITLIEKSGTVSAMLEHGLPVLCVSNPWHPRGIHESIDIPAGVQQYIKGDLGQYFVPKLPLETSSKVHTVSLQFVDDLQAATV